MSRKLTQEEFENKANLIHNHKYDYSRSIYVKNSIKIEIVCNKHGKFLQTPNSHLNGIGCPTCGIENNKKKLASTTKEFIKKAIKIHQNKYDYSKCNYENNKKDVIIICKMHGEFKQTPNAHLVGKGCYSCGQEIKRSKKTKSTLKFIEQAKKIHNYNYDKTIYTGCYGKVIITCNSHGDFLQQANGHLLGQGCPKCSTNISKKESAWLDSLNNPSLKRQFCIKINNIKFVVDGFDLSTNTIYEFYGDYWHGNPNVYNGENVNINNKKSFKELYLNTMYKEHILTQAGYKVVSMWEHDWNQISK